jgi:5-methyltetrahydrofolate--homocysteine methyltransferase
MIGKTNWEEAKKDYVAWWREESKKPLLHVTQAGEPDTPTRWTGWNLAQNPVSIEENIRDFEHAYGNYKYLLDSFPLLTINLGPGIMAAYLGGDVTVRPETVWFDKSPALQLNEDITLDTRNWWYRITRDMTAIAAERGKGKFITGMTDLGGTLDILSSLRGAEQLLFDLTENPARVREWCGQITGTWLKTFWDFNSVIAPHQEGTAGWMGLWSPGTWFPIQCDFANMISPAMFERFVAPDLQAVARELDFTIYHWETPGQLAHLDCLLSMPEIDGIQWNPGPQLEPPDSPKWYPLFQKIQAKGKLLVLGGINLDHIDTFFANIDPKGVFLMQGVRDAKELEKLAKYC